MTSSRFSHGLYLLLKKENTTLLQMKTTTVFYNKNTTFSYWIHTQKYSTFSLLLRFYIYYYRNYYIFATTEKILHICYYRKVCTSKVSPPIPMPETSSMQSRLAVVCSFCKMSQKSIMEAENVSLDDQGLLDDLLTFLDDSPILPLSKEFTSPLRF